MVFTFRVLSILFIEFKLNASALRQNYMIKCNRISWEGHDVRGTIGDSFLPLSVTVQYLCSVFQKRPFISPNIETKNLWSRVPHDKLGVAKQVTFYGS
jgi:hypothetical protein